MNRPKPGSIAVDAFFDNFGFAALFGKLRIPGAPDMLVDPRTVDECLAVLIEGDCLGPIESAGSSANRQEEAALRRSKRSGVLTNLLTGKPETPNKPLQDIRHSR